MDSSLPLRCLNSDTLTGLTNALTVENALKHDWRHLADHVGFSFTHIALMRQHGRSDKAMLLLEVWERTGESSLPKLIVALMQTNLRSSLDVLTNARELRDRGVDFDALATMARDTPRSHQFPSLPESVVIIYPRSDLLTPPEVPFSPFPSPSSSSSASPSSQSSLQLVEELRQHGCCAMVDEDSPRNSLDHLDIRGINAVIPHSVFISYYPEPKNRVFNSCLQRLVDEVRSYGLTVYFDAACSGKELRQYGGKNRWKEVFMQKADTIVLICTPKLFKEDLSLSNPNKQRRLFATSNIHVDLRLLRSIAMHRIIPVLLGDESAANCIPFYFKGQNFQRWPSEDFMYCIARVPKYEPRPVLKKKILRPKVINYPQARNWNPFDG